MVKKFNLGEKYAILCQMWQWDRDILIKTKDRGWKRNSTLVLLVEVGTTKKGGQGCRYDTTRSWGHSSTSP